MQSLLPVFPFSIVMNSIFVHCYFRAIEYTWFVHVVPSKILFIVVVNFKNMNDKIVDLKKLFEQPNYQPNLWLLTYKGQEWILCNFQACIAPRKIL